MSYALFQHDVEPLDTEQVARALDALPWLVRADAPQLVRRASGVLVDRISRADAEALAKALADRDQYVEVVEQAWLNLPPAQLCRRATVAAGAFEPQDFYGRPNPVPWQRILLLAAGRHGATRRVAVEPWRNQIMRPSTGWSRTGSTLERMRDAALGSTEYENREHELVVMEIVTDEPARYRIQLDKFDYSYLGERRAHSAGQNFPLLVEDLVTRAPDAARTHGVHRLARRAGRLPRYATLAQLEREIAWALWRYCGPGTRIDGGAPYRAHPSMRPRLAHPLSATATAPPRR